MPIRSLLVVMTIFCAAAQGQDPVVRIPAPLPSLLQPYSILRAKRPFRTPVRVPWFSLKSQLDPARRVVRLVDDDSYAGSAYVGMEYEPDDSDEELLESEPELEFDSGQPVLEPPDVPAGPAPRGRRDQAKGDAIPLDGAADEPENEEEKEDGPATNRSSFGWIAGTGNQLGMLEWVSRDLAVLDYSAADRASFRIQAGHAFTWLTGPDTTDLPPYLFSLFVEVGAGAKVNETWSLDVVVSPSWNTDFANKSYQLFRLPWQAVNTFKLDDEWKLVVGVTDLDREDIQLLPVAGLIYRPLDGSKDFDMVFPRPKMAWRLGHNEDGCHWGYVAAELGGNSYSIQRPGAVQDIVTLRDYRLMVGWERRGEKRHACRLEAGWVFGRAVEYQSGIGDFNPGQTGIIRLSSDF